ncbi:MAG: HAMP domain-containing histidine kinase [Gemmatimonadetes bacterium]|nr:HAMP domain-containing histidine kinase [Gemmatimonadota bacterium]
MTPLHVQANRLELIRRLAEDIAHELKNPLHSLVINLELLRRRVAGGATDSALDRVAILEQELGRVHRLTDALLQLMRASHQNGRAFAIEAGMAELLPLLEAQARHDRVELTCESAGDETRAAGRWDAIRFVILNLVANALDAMRPTGGALELRWSCTDDEVSLCVRDTGPGVSPELLDRFWLPGVSTHPGRAGLGLAVARHLAEEAGGRLELEAPAAAAGGAVFRLVLKRSTALDP